MILLVAICAVYLAKFKNESEWGGIIKDAMVKYPDLVRLVNLDKPGDAKYIFLAKNPDEVKVHIYYPGILKPDEEVDDWINSFTNVTANRKAIITKTRDDSLGFVSEYSEFGLRELVNQYHKNSGDEDLKIIYLTASIENPTNIGMTRNRDEIFIFKKTLNNLSDDSATLNKFEKSTLIHEWGHLLGLDHIEKEECIMNEKVEVVDGGGFALNRIPQDYCPEELQQIRF